MRDTTNPTMRIDTISLIASSFVTAFLGIAVLIRNFRNPVYRAFSVFCGVLLARDFLCLMKGFESATFYEPRLFLLVSLALGPISLWWLREMQPRAFQYWSRGMWVYGVFLSVLFVFLLVPNLEPWVGLLQALVEASFLIPAFLWTRLLVRVGESEGLPRERVRYRYAVWGLVVVIALHLTDTLYFSNLSSVVPLGTLARSVYLIFLFQLFIKKELLTTQELISRFFLFGVISLVLSGIYWLLVGWVDSRPGLFLFNTIIASFAILVLFEPLKSGVSRLMNHLFLRKNIELEAELNALADDLRGVADPKELSTRLASSLKRVLGIERATLFLLGRDGLTYDRADSKFEEGVSELSAANPLVEYMTLRRGRPFVLETLSNDLDAFHSIQGRKFLADCLESLRALEADLVIPFFFDGKVVGFLTAPLSEKIILSTELLRLFIPVSKQIALLLKSSQTLGALREREQLATLGEMAAGLAHEIKNPLGAIKGAAELLSEEKSPEITQEYLKIIQDEADRLSGVLTQFLDFAKPRRNDPESFCNPVQVIEHTAALVLRDSSVTFTVHSECQDLVANVDPELLKQVLLNLFLNAVQAMESSSKKELSVVLRELKPRRRWAWGIPFFKSIEGWQNLADQSSRSFVEIEVQDSGPGIPPEKRTKVFDPFFTTKPNGTGLGLAICRRVIEAVGGSIQVKANFPQGTRFIVHLPSVHQPLVQQAPNEWAEGLV